MTTWTKNSQLGPYALISPIGTGGMGEVWKARDTRLNRIVAVKRLKEEHRKRFEHEARSIAALNHPQQRISAHGWIYAIDNSSCVIWVFP